MGSRLYADAWKFAKDCVSRNLDPSLYEESFPLRYSDADLLAKLSTSYASKEFALASGGGLYVKNIKSLGVRDEVSSTFPAKLTDTGYEDDPLHYLDWSTRASSLIFENLGSFSHVDGGRYRSELLAERKTLIAGRPTDMGNQLGNDIGCMLKLCGAKVCDSWFFASTQA